MIAILLAFAAIARGAHDLWAATIVHLAALAIFVGALLRSSGKSSRGFYFPFAIPAAILAAAWLLSFRNTTAPGESFLTIGGWFASLLIFYAAMNALRTDAALTRFLAIMVPCLLFQAGENIFQLRQFSLAGLTETPGTLVNANLQAAFALLWVPPLFDRVRGARRIGSAWTGYWAAGLIACATILFLASSGWAWICLVIFAPLIFGEEQAISFARRRPMAAALLALAGVGIVAAVIWMKVAYADVRPWSRLNWWTTAYRIFLEYP